MELHIPKLREDSYFPSLLAGLYPQSTEKMSVGVC